MKKRFMTGIMAAAMTMSMMFGANGTLVAEASGLTQASDASTVKYWGVDFSKIDMLEEMFDYDYYKSQNADLVEVLGDDYTTLFKHFVYCGIYEGRTCNANFDPAAYASAYEDLKDAYGTDIFSYYEHYYYIGSKENRTLTTIEACANAGITVQSLCDENVKVSPFTYMIANKIGVYDYTAVQNALSNAVSNGSGFSSVISGNNADVVIVPQGDEEAMELCKGLELLCTITAKEESNDGYSVFIRQSINVDNEVGYGIYRAGELLKTYGSYDSSYTTGKYVKVYTAEGYVIKATDLGVVVYRLVEYTDEHSSHDSYPTITSYLCDEYIDTYGEYTERYIDSEGTVGTDYNISLEITDYDETGFTLETGVYNEENSFAIYNKYEIDSFGDNEIDSNTSVESNSVNSNTEGATDESSTNSSDNSIDDNTESINDSETSDNGTGDATVNTSTNNNVDNSTDNTHDDSTSTTNDGE